MKKSPNDPVRLRRLLQNNYRVSDETTALLKNDLEKLLSAYFDDLSDLSFTVENDEESFFITLRARAASVKDVKVL